MSVTVFASPTQLAPSVSSSTLPQAALELGAIKYQLRDFEAAITLLSRVGPVPPERAATVNEELTYAYLVRGHLDAARASLEAFRKTASARLRGFRWW